MATSWDYHSQSQWPQHQTYGYPTTATTATAMDMFDTNTDMFCDNCRNSIPPGPQWHCSICAGGDFDLCDMCRRNGISCHCGSLFPLTIIPGRGRERGYGTTQQAPAHPTSYATTPAYPATSQPVSYTSSYPSYPNTTAAPTASSHYNYPPAAHAAAPQPLSTILPASATLKEWTSNPSLNAFLSRYTQYTKSTAHTNPAYENLMCKTPSEYDAWLANTHEPQDAWYEQIITCLTDLNESMSNYIANKARSGLEIWSAYPTKDGEVCDCYDIMIKVLEKIDELRKAQQSSQDDNNRQWVGSRGAQTEEDVKKLIEWYNAAALENHLNGAKARMHRRQEFADVLRKVVAKADEKEKHAFETVLSSTSAAISSGGAGGNDRDTMVKAVQVMGVHLEVRRSMQVRLANAEMEQVAAEHSYKVLGVTDTAQEEALVAEGNARLDRIEGARDAELQRLAQEWDFRVNKPIIPVIAAMSGGVAPTSNTGVPLSNPTAAPPTQATAAANAGSSASRSLVNSRSVGATAPGGGYYPQGGGAGPYTPGTAPAATTSGSKLPLSFYSNMLHQQHVTNMNIINNIGGGNKQYWSINPVTGQFTY